MNLGRLAKEAKRGGFFPLRTGVRIEFLSLATGKCVVTYFLDSQRWTSVFGQKGPARNPYGALNAAVRIEKERKANENNREVSGRVH